MVSTFDIFQLKMLKDDTKKNILINKIWKIYHNSKNNNNNYGSNLIRENFLLQKYFKNFRTYFVGKIIIFIEEETESEGRVTFVILACNVRNRFHSRDVCKDMMWKLSSSNIDIVMLIMLIRLSSYLIFPIASYYIPILILEALTRLYIPSGVQISSTAGWFTKHWAQYPGIPTAKTSSSASSSVKNKGIVKILIS